MGVGGISIWQLLIILVIVLLLFGTKRLKNIGADLGAAIKGFRSSMSNSETDAGDPATKPDPAASLSAQQAAHAETQTARKATDREAS